MNGWLKLTSAISFCSTRSGEVLRNLIIVAFLLLTSIPSSAIVVEWGKTYGNAFSGIADVKAVDDGFILAGFTGNVYDSDAWIIRTDAQGNEVWNVTFGG